MTAFSPEQTRDALRRGAAGRLLLGLLSRAYAGGIAARRLLYAKGVLRSRRLPVPVICFGNVLPGATGKPSPW